MEEKEKQKGTACKRGLSATTSKNQNVSPSGDTCAVCCGAYVDDVDDITGEVTADWIQCTEDDCEAWSHVDCLDQDAGGGRGGGGG